jgi:hypothetical protein
VDDFWFLLVFHFIGIVVCITYIVILIFHYASSVVTVFGFYRVATTSAAVELRIQRFASNSSAVFIKRRCIPLIIAADLGN